MTLDTHIKISCSSNSFSSLEIPVLSVTLHQGIVAGGNAICGRIENLGGSAGQTMNMFGSEAFGAFGIAELTVISG